MNEITDLVTGIETRVALVLGGDYSSLPFTYDVPRNSFRSSKKRYGVLAGDIEEVDYTGVLGSLTVLQTFTVKVTDNYTPSQTMDGSQKTVTIGLMEKCLAIFKDLINTKAGTPSLVLNLQDGMSTVSTFYEDENVAEATMDFQVLYRKLL